MADGEAINTSPRDTPVANSNAAYNEPSSSQIDTGLEQAIPRSMVTGNITQGVVPPTSVDDEYNWEDEDEDEEGDSDESYDSEIAGPQQAGGLHPHDLLADDWDFQREHNPEGYYDDGLDEFSDDEHFDHLFDDAPEGMPEEMVEAMHRDLAAAIFGGGCGGGCSHHPYDEYDYDVEDDSEEDSLYGEAMDPEPDLGYDSDVYQSEKGDGLDSFPQFMRLPPELRASIWETYAPELTMRAQLLDFQIRRRPERFENWDFRPDDYTVFDGISLPNATHRIRKILAVHQESRNTVLGRFPDTLAFRWKFKPEENGAMPETGLIRFSKERDVVLFGGYHTWDPRWEGQPTPMHMPGFAENIQNAAFHVVGQLRDEELKNVSMILNNLPNLKNVFYCHLCRAFSLKDMRWLAAPSTRERMVRHRGNGMVHAELFCWPDPNTPSDYTVTPRLNRVVENLRPRATEAGWNLLPMLGFNGHTHLALREEAIDNAKRKALKKTQGGDKDDGSSSDDDDSVLDIDDGMDFMFDDELGPGYHIDENGEYVFDEDVAHDIMMDMVLNPGAPGSDDGDYWEYEYADDFGWPMP